MRLGRSSTFGKRQKAMAQSFVDVVSTMSAVNQSNEHYQSSIYFAPPPGSTCAFADCLIKPDQITCSVLQGILCGSIACRWKITFCYCINKWLTFTCRGERLWRKKTMNKIPDSVHWHLILDRDRRIEFIFQRSRVIWKYRSEALYENIQNFRERSFLSSSLSHANIHRTFGLIISIDNRHLCPMKLGWCW